MKTFDGRFWRDIRIGSPAAARRHRHASSSHPGTGAVLGRESGVVEGEFLVAVDVQAVETP